MSYLNSVSLIGLVGADPEQRQARNNNGSKFTELPLALDRAVATQRSWKNTDDEWASKTEWHGVCVCRPRLAEYVATTIKKGSHVLVDDIRSTRRRDTPPLSSFNPTFIRSKALLRGWEEERVRAEKRITAEVRRY